MLKVLCCCDINMFNSYCLNKRILNYKDGIGVMRSVIRAALSCYPSGFLLSLIIISNMILTCYFLLLGVYMKDEIMYINHATYRILYPILKRLKYTNKVFATALLISS